MAPGDILHGEEEGSLSLPGGKDVHFLCLLLLHAHILCPLLEKIPDSICSACLDVGLPVSFHHGVCCVDSAFCSCLWRWEKDPALHVVSHRAEVRGLSVKRCGSGARRDVFCTRVKVGRSLALLTLSVPVTFLLTYVFVYTFCSPLMGCISCSIPLWKAVDYVHMKMQRCAILYFCLGKRGDAVPVCFGRTCL